MGIRNTHIIMVGMTERNRTLGRLDIGADGRIILR
jgi:hypothetical protein